MYYCVWGGCLQEDRTIYAPASALKQSVACPATRGSRARAISLASMQAVQRIKTFAAPVGVTAKRAVQLRQSPLPGRAAVGSLKEALVHTCDSGHCCAHARVRCNERDG